MRLYTVTISLNGFIGAEQEYRVYAETLGEAKAEALEEAVEDLEVISAQADDEDEDDEPLTEMELARIDAYNEVMEGAMP